MFWASVAFIPLGIIGAFMTELRDNGVGLTFTSNNPVVIFFAHIGEELLGLILSPIWFIKAIINHSFTFATIIDYLVYFAEIAFIIVGLVRLFN